MMEIELGSGWIFSKSCKVYLFISTQRIVGCLLAEPIKKAFKVLSCSMDGGAFGGNRGPRPVPPEKGVFPLDHMHLCGLVSSNRQLMIKLLSIGHNPERLSLLKGGIVYSNAVVLWGALVPILVAAEVKPNT